MISHDQQINCCNLSFLPPSTSTSTNIFGALHACHALPGVAWEIMTSVIWKDWQGCYKEMWIHGSLHADEVILARPLWLMYNHFADY